MHSKKTKNWVSNGGHFTCSMKSILVTNAIAQHELTFANLGKTYKRNTTKRLRAASLYCLMNSRYHDALKSFIKHLHLCGSFHYYHFSSVQSSIHLYQLSAEPGVSDSAPQVFAAHALWATCNSAHCRAEQNTHRNDKVPSFNAVLKCPLMYP